LAANGSLCSEQSALKMPTDFVGQNGATLNQSTQIAVTGCKPAITVVSHKVKGRTATIVVSVPAAGKLVASAKGLSKASKKAGGASTLTVKLTLTKGEAAFLGKHTGRKLAAKIKLTFIPKKGGKLKTSVTVLIGSGCSIELGRAGTQHFIWRARQIKCSPCPSPTAPAADVP